MVSKSSASPMSPQGDGRDIPSLQSKQTSASATPVSAVAVSTASTRSYETPFAQLTPKIEYLCFSIWSKLLSRPEDGLLPEKELPRTFTQRLLGRSNSLIPKRLRSKSILALSSEPSRKVIVERMTNGTYNRLAAITIPQCTPRAEVKLVLRIPRFDWQKPNADRDVAILRYVRQKSTLPVANIVAFDFSEDNPLDSAYVIQSRVPGTDLVRHGDLTTEQRVGFASQFGNIMRLMQEVQHPWPGRITIDVQSKPDTFVVRPFEVESVVADPETDHYKDIGSLWNDDLIQVYYADHFNFLRTQFGRWRAEELHVSPYLIDKPDIYRDLVQMAAEMDATFCLGSSDNISQNSLCHLDLHARNIMVRIEEDHKIRVTGIIDWDSAVIAPFFVGCAPPNWLWAGDDEQNLDEDDEGNASKYPEKEEDRQVQAAWEEAVGEDFLKYSYEPEYRLGRKLFHWALNGIHNSWEKEQALKVLQEWSVIHKDLQEMIKAAQKEDAMDVDASEPGNNAA